MNITTKLTERQVESIDPLEEQEIFVWDSKLNGFGLRVFLTGRRTYLVQYRNQFGRKRHKKWVCMVLSPQSKLGNKLE